MKRDQKLRDRYGYGGNGCRKKENDFRGFTRKILVESTEMCYDTSVGKIHAQIWFIGRTLASQAGKAGSIPVICFYIYRKCAKTCRNGSLRILIFCILTYSLQNATCFIGSIFEEEHPAIPVKN